MDFDFFNNPDNLMIFFILVPLLGERGWSEVDCKESDGVGEFRNELMGVSSWDNRSDFQSEIISLGHYLVLCKD
jgi:hypothetical protein